MVLFRADEGRLPGRQKAVGGEGLGAPADLPPFPCRSTEGCWPSATPWSTAWCGTGTTWSASGSTSTPKISCRLSLRRCASQSHLPASQFPVLPSPCSALPAYAVTLPLHFKLGPAAFSWCWGGGGGPHSRWLPSRVFQRKLGLGRRNCWQTVGCYPWE